MRFCRWGRFEVLKIHFRSNPRHNVSAVETLQVRIGQVDRLQTWWELPQSGTQRVLYVQCHYVKYWNRNNSSADCSISLKFGTEFEHITADTLQILKIKGSRSRSQHNVRYQRSSKKLWDSNAGWPTAGVSVKVENDWCSVGRPQFAMHRNCHILYYLSHSYSI